MNESRQPGGWSRQTRNLALFLVLGAVIWMVYVARELIGPLIVSALLAYVLDPIVTFFNYRTRLPRGLVVTLLFLLSSALLVGVSVAVAPEVARQGEDLLLEFNLAVDELELILGAQSEFFGIAIPTQQIFDDLQAAPEAFAESDRILDLLNTATTNIVWVAVILIITFYLLLDWGQLRDWIIGLAPPRYSKDAQRLYVEIRDIWQAYLRGTLVLMFVVGLLTGVMLAMVGMPGAAALGVLTGVLDAIMSIGPALAMVVAALVAWFQGSTFLPVSDAVFVLIILAVYGVVQALENVWLRPRIMGRRLQLHPAVVFLAIVAALTLVGPVGALVVLPVVRTAGTLGRYLRHRILDLDPWPDSPAAAADEEVEHDDRSDLE